MKFIVLPRRGGKTERMLKWLADEMDAGRNPVIVTFCEREAMRLYELCVDRQMDVRRDQFLSCDTARIGALQGMPFRPVGVDNADLVLEGLLRHRVDGPCTVTWGE